LADSATKKSTGVEAEVAAAWKYYQGCQVCIIRIYVVYVYTVSIICSYGVDYTFIRSIYIGLCQNVSNAQINTYEYVLNTYNRAYNTYKTACNTYNRAYYTYKYGVLI
jgi:hypothetical protein